MTDTNLPTIQLFPLDLIDCGAITRDRTTVEPQAMTELERSIEASGLRQPIELFERTDPYEGCTHGLISGHRRLIAFRNLLERTGNDRWATIPAFIRGRTDMASALAAMVEENEIRVDISPYERGLIAVRARDEGAFGGIEEAVEALYPHATRYKRSRVRALAQFAEEVGGYFKTPEKISFRQAMRIMAALNLGFGDVVRTALDETSITDHDHQWDLIQPILAEAEANAKKPERSDHPGRPRRILRPASGVTIRRERTIDGWSLHFTGREATGPLMDLVLDNIELMYAPA